MSVHNLDNTIKEFCRVCQLLAAVFQFGALGPLLMRLVQSCTY